MDEMVFESCKSDAEVWLRSSMKYDSKYYYLYVLICTDDIMAIMQNPEDFICHELGKTIVVKPNSIVHPTQYLGNKVSYFILDNGRNVMSFILSQYVQDTSPMGEDHT